MSESRFKLREKTVILSGPFSTILQSLGNHYIELGADVAILASEEDFNGVQRFLNNLVDLREVHPEYGRAAPVLATITDDKSARDTLTRVAELFGSVDIYIDTHLLDRAHLYSSEHSEKTLKAFQVMCEEVSEFLQNRKRGKIVCLGDHHNLFDTYSDAPEAGLLEEVSKARKAVSETLFQSGVPYNFVDLGLTEEFLLYAFPQAASVQKALDNIQKKHPRVKLLKPVDVNNLIIFLSSPISTAIDNQTISLTQIDAP